MSGNGPLEMSGNLPLVFVGLQAWEAVEPLCPPSRRKLAGQTANGYGRRVLLGAVVPPSYQMSSVKPAGQTANGHGRRVLLGAAALGQAA